MTTCPPWCRTDHSNDLDDSDHVHWGDGLDVTLSRMPASLVGTTADGTWGVQAASLRANLEQLPGETEPAVYLQVDDAGDKVTMALSEVEELIDALIGLVAEAGHAAAGQVTSSA